jgi:D-galactose 1-dehydrogenase
MRLRRRRLRAGQDEGALMPIRIGLVGVGKIARDQHIPAISASSEYRLVATASPHGRVEGVPSYSTIEELLAGPDPIDAVVMCQPPQFRFDATRAALETGKHVFLEKPPGSTLSEIPVLAKLADDRGVALFASWHSRLAPGVEPARRWLADKRIGRVEIIWKEDVRHWHPGQDWIWRPGGLGVFDTGINALSIVTTIAPHPFHLTRATLDFPQNRAAPIAAGLAFIDTAGAEIVATFDWRQSGPPTWDMHIETDVGRLDLTKGATELAIGGAARPLPPEAEYRGLYDRFAALVAERRSEIDVSPLRHVADAFLRGEHRIVEPFED